MFISVYHGPNNSSNTEARARLAQNKNVILRHTTFWQSQSSIFHFEILLETNYREKIQLCHTKTLVCI
jgi:hypothetical protein